MVSQESGTQFAAFLFKSASRFPSNNERFETAGSRAVFVRKSMTRSTMKETAMNNRIKRRVVCCPSMTDAKLEERLVLSAATPPPAPAPFFSAVSIGNPIHARTAAQLRLAHTRMSELATVVRRDAVAFDTAPMGQRAVHATTTVLSHSSALPAGSARRVVTILPGAPVGSSLTSAPNEPTSVASSDANAVSSEPGGSPGSTVSLGSTGTAGGVPFQSR